MKFSSLSLPLFALLSFASAAPSEMAGRSPVPNPNILEYSAEHSVEMIKRAQIEARQGVPTQPSHTYLIPTREVLPHHKLLKSIAPSSLLAFPISHNGSTRELRSEATACADQLSRRRSQLNVPDYCATNQIAQPQFQDYSDPRALADTLPSGIRTAWSSSVFVHGREYRAALWRDYRYLEQSREEAAEVAWKALQSAAATNNANQAQYNRSTQGDGGLAKLRFNVSTSTDILVRILGDYNTGTHFFLSL
ncbi:hypothetical protein yc1106_02583 [Curvularia clavata]|uniref:Uncharacterized protein n=1 Tax=Curvularia clavata TaxID=95742 RepID=A0A9Q9DR30_CURCL|nr:hypothetical protein yc1106_02583 [Curvularia clavata]